MPDSELRKSMMTEGHPMAGLPLCAAMGIELVRSGKGEALLRLPFSAELVGDPETGVLGGGAITTLLDTCCGTAVITAAKDIVSTATLDLRIDYMRPATPGEPVLSHALCYRVTRTVAFVRASAYHDDPETPIASAAAAFIIDRKGSI